MAFCGRRFTALGAMQAIKAAGIVMPDEIAIVGFANEAFGEYITPSLSSVNQQTVTMGEEAAKLFFELMRNGDAYIGKPRKKSAAARADMPPIEQQTLNGYIIAVRAYESYLISISQRRSNLLWQ